MLATTGHGQLVDDGFTVFAGSKARKQIVPSAPNWLPPKRQELLASGALSEDGNHLVFKEDYTFKTPTGAATALLGCSANGWTVWKNRLGKTLDEVKRQNTEPESDGEDE